MHSNHTTQKQSASLIETVLRNENCMPEPRESGPSFTTDGAVSDLCWLAPCPCVRLSISRYCDRPYELCVPVVKVSSHVPSSARLDVYN